MAGNIPGKGAPQQSLLPLLSSKAKIDKLRVIANVLSNKMHRSSRLEENTRLPILRKKEAKKEIKEWATPMNIFIRFAEAFTSMHLSEDSSII